MCPFSYCQGAAARYAGCRCFIDLCNLRPPYGTRAATADLQIDRICPLRKQPCILTRTRPAMKAARPEVLHSGHSRAGNQVLETVRVASVIFEPDRAPGLLLDDRSVSPDLSGCENIAHLQGNDRSLLSIAMVARGSGVRRTCPDRRGRFWPTMRSFSTPCAPGGEGDVVVNTVGMAMPFRSATPTRVAE